MALALSINADLHTAFLGQFVYAVISGLALTMVNRLRV